MELGIRGAANASPSLAAREPFVAIAWVAGAPGAPEAVYVATSADNGATFSAPLKLGAGIVDAASAPHVVFEGIGGNGQQRLSMPDLRVDWASREQGRFVQRAVRSIDGGRTFVNEPADRVHLFYTGAADAPSPALERVIGDAARGAIAHPGIGPQEDGTAVAVWDEPDGVGRRVMLRRVLFGAGGAVQPIETFPLSASASAVAPVLGRVAGGVIVAWTSGDAAASTIAVRRVGLDPLCATTPVRLEAQERRRE
jgi:hypothetical protein